MSLNSQPMRISGQQIYRDRVIEIQNPFTGECIGTVPKATVDDIRQVVSAMIPPQAINSF